MKVALIGAELEENLGLRYIASSLESKNVDVDIIPFNFEKDIEEVVKSVMQIRPQIVGLSMVFTGRGMEFCRLASALRDEGYTGHINAGGPFASFNCKKLLRDFKAFDTITLGEGENILCELTANISNISKVKGICHRNENGEVIINPPEILQDNLDELPFPKRITFHAYFGQNIASILTSRGCWRNCAFCSIRAWYDRVGGKKYRTRSIENLVEEMKLLYNKHDVRIFNFQDDNFFTPQKKQTLQRFTSLRKGLREEAVDKIAIAIKARPESITQESIDVLDDLGLFRVFLGVENASENGLRNLNRKSTVDDALNALNILNDFDIHVAFNLLMFEPDTSMDDILTNLNFIERNIENPFNFCRAEPHAGTGLERKLKVENKLLGNYFGLDYRIKDPYSEVFHQIANYSFFDRNFNDYGLHYFNMQVDFTFQLMRRFYPEILNQSLRSSIKNFIKLTNLDTYQFLCQIYDFVESTDPNNRLAIQGYAQEMREYIDEKSSALHSQGEKILDDLDSVYNEMLNENTVIKSYNKSNHQNMAILKDEADIFGLTPVPIPYETFKSKLSRK